MARRKVPKLGARKDGRAYATDPRNRRPVYFGKAGSPESVAAYERWLVGLLQSPAKPAVPAGTTVARLTIDYMAHAETFYRKRGRVTSEVGLVRHALAPLNDHCGARPAAEFSPLDFAAVREKFLALGWTRQTVNKQGDRVRRCFRWGVETGRVPAAVWHGLLAVPALKAGRTRAPENRRVQPVPLSDLYAAIARVRPRTAALVRLHLALCCRADEVVQLRGCDIDRDTVPWKFVPASHKTEHHGLGREIWCGPEARALLLPLLEQAAPEEWLFPARPCGAARQARAARGRPPLAGGPMTVDGYRRTIRGACDRAGVPHWSPGRVRHTSLTLVRAKFGLEAAQHAAGHQRADITELYAQRNRDLARRVAEEGFLPRAE